MSNNIKEKYPISKRKYMFLDTENLNKKQAKIVITELKKLIKDIKMGIYSKENIYKNIFGFKYYFHNKIQYSYKDYDKKQKYMREDDINFINIETFINIKVKQVLAIDFNSSYPLFYEKSKNRIFCNLDDLYQKIYLYVIRRLKNNFQMEFDVSDNHSDNKNLINNILSYINKIINSAVHHYFRDVLKIKLRSHADINILNQLSFKSYNDELYNIRFASSRMKSPEDILIEKEQEKELINIIKFLSEKERKIIYMNKICGISQNDIAAELGVSQQAISKKIKKIEKFIKNNYNI